MRDITDRTALDETAEVRKRSKSNQNNYSHVDSRASNIFEPHT